MHALADSHDSLQMPTAMPVADASSELPSEPIDMETFQQILELDENPSVREFSTDMVWQYFAQAKVTFTDMDEALYVRAPARRI